LAHFSRICGTDRIKLEDYVKYYPRKMSDGEIAYILLLALRHYKGDETKTVPLPSKDNVWLFFEPAFDAKSIKEG